MNNRKFRILVVEDEEAIRAGLVDVLVYHGYEVEYAADGQIGLDKASSGHFDLVLLDVMLPLINGFEVCNKVRERDKELAIIMLTAKGTDEDIIQGLKLGADDYVTKPFSVAQLVLRIDAVLRRSVTGRQMLSTFVLGNGMVVDTENLSVSNSQQPINFTRRELEILMYLQGNGDRPVSRDELLNKVWGYNKNLEIETRTVDIHIAKLRRKLESNPKEPEVLLTVRGAGYRLLCHES